MALDPRIRKQLMARRLVLGFSQRKLARLMGTSQSAISELESGEHDPTINTLMRWSDALGMHVRISLVKRRG